MYHWSIEKADNEQRTRQETRAKRQEPKEPCEPREQQEPQGPQETRDKTGKIAKDRPASRRQWGELRKEIWHTAEHRPSHSPTVDKGKDLKNGTEYSTEPRMKQSIGKKTGQHCAALAQSLVKSVFLTMQLHRSNVVDPRQYTGGTNSVICEQLKSAARQHIGTFNLSLRWISSPHVPSGYST